MDNRILYKTRRLLMTGIYMGASCVDPQKSVMQKESAT